ncbi:MAG: GDSL-type esterase/lipase family protein [Candidatus Gastranaerophilales bacterium]|nr:GDSL-type esterase/lipase family protein [Candidatus Gastranaerophilales bacterium]
MKKILCYGDSNTYGYNPENSGRYNKTTRWTALLVKLLGNDYEIIEEGCNNRTGFAYNPCGFIQNGQKYLPVCLREYSDIDIAILALGTNDLQTSFHIDWEIVEKGLLTLIATVKKFHPGARIIIVPPVILSEDILNGAFAHQFDRNSIDKSKQIGQIYKQIAQASHCEIIDFNEFVSPSEQDGLHYCAQAHAIIAEKLTDFIEEGTFNENNR